LRKSDERKIIEISFDRGHRCCVGNCYLLQNGQLVDWTICQFIKMLTHSVTKKLGLDDCCEFDY